MSTSTHEPAATANATAFAAWATVYDEPKNPLVSLEGRVLRRILPDFAGTAVIDIGCGTGRWLDYVARSGAATLCGLDSSREMLEIAAGKHLANARLVHAELPSVPVASGAFDVAIASFVLSYVMDLEKCASELARVVRRGGDLFISDMHPATAAALGWSRSFSTAGQTYRLSVQDRSIAEIIETFVSRGFSLVTSLEPRFGTPEQNLFRKAGKAAEWRATRERPPIHLLHFRQSISADHGTPRVVLRGGRCVVGAREPVQASASLHADVIASVLSDSARPWAGPVDDAREIDLNGYLLFPGLVNAHDHLEFALYPRLGSGRYRNATEWAEDIQINEQETIELHKRVPKDVRLWWGGIRNLLCGVTTVCHHNPMYPVLQSGQFPVRVVRKYGWEHSLAFADDIPAALRRTSTGEPFLIHAAEGVDESAAAEFAALDAMGAVERRSVFIHGLALDEDGIAKLNERGAALVVCPSSNDFLFQATHTLEQLQAVHRLALGSDSPLTAAGDLLDELRYVHRACGLSAERLYEMVTDQAARILRLQRGEGTLRVGALPDCMAIADGVGEPAEILSRASWRDVELVVVRGQVQLASDKIYDRLPGTLKTGLTALRIAGELRWLRGPLRGLLESAESVLGKGNVRVGGLQVTSLEGRLCPA